MKCRAQNFSHRSLYKLVVLATLLQISCAKAMEKSETNQRSSVTRYQQETGDDGTDSDIDNETQDNPGNKPLDSFSLTATSTDANAIPSAAIQLESVDEFFAVPDD